MLSVLRWYWLCELLVEEVGSWVADANFAAMVTSAQAILVFQTQRICIEQLVLTRLRIFQIVSPKTRHWLQKYGLSVYILLNDMKRSYNAHYYSQNSCTSELDVATLENCLFPLRFRILIKTHSHSGNSNDPSSY